MSSLTPPDSNLERETGNTKVSRGASAKHWCFTLNNFTKDDIEKLISDKFFQKFLFQEEIGEGEETPHLQGQISFKKKQKFDWWKKHYPKIHVEKTVSVLDSNEYCIKTETGCGKIYSNWWYPELDPFENGFRDWQSKLLRDLSQRADDRKIIWVYDPPGNGGKSTFARYLHREKGALIVSGKVADMKHAIIKWSETHGYPHIIIIDIPRSIDLHYFSYTGIEEIKNGFFYSSKYEGGVVDMPRPHVVVMSNEEPDHSKMSKGRFDVRIIGVDGDFGEDFDGQVEQEINMNRFRDINHVDNDF